MARVEYPLSCGVFLPEDSSDAGNGILPVKTGLVLDPVLHNFSLIRR
jgi:hypothetical protein